MNPKKSKELIPKVAERLNLPAKVIEDITNFYYREVWTSLTNGESIKVHLTNLGDFNIKHWLLDKEINKLKGYIDSTKFKSKQRYAAGLKLQDKIDILNNLKDKLEEENQRKDFIYEHKRVVNENKKKEPYPDMEE